MFMKSLNERLLKEVHNCPIETVKYPTALKWMKELGFTRCRAVKGYYTDQHNRDDVVFYRDNVFLPLMEEIKARFIVYDGDDMENETWPIDGKPIVLVTHDESTFFEHDEKAFLWMEGDKKALRSKSRGRSLMISGFVCACHGFMKAIINNVHSKSYILFEAGTNREGWWNNDKLVQQVQDCFPLIKHLHPNADILFAFDNSMAHHKRPPNGLCVELLTLKDGGKNIPLMKETTFTDINGVIHSQKMQLPDGTPKGMRTMLMERGKWMPHMKTICADCENDIPFCF